MTHRTGRKRQEDGVLEAFPRAAANQWHCVALPMQGARRLEFHSHRRPIGYRLCWSRPSLLHTTITNTHGFY